MSVEIPETVYLRIPHMRDKVESFFLALEHAKASLKTFSIDDRVEGKIFDQITKAEKQAQKLIVDFAVGNYEVE